MVAVIVFTGMGLYSRYYPDTIGYPPLELNPTTAMKVSEELGVYMWVFTYCSVYTCGCEGCEVLREGGVYIWVFMYCSVSYMWV